MMAQYMKVKNEYSECIVMYRLGDFYEMFFEDAEVASKILGITLTARNKNGENKTPMCGVPFHALDQYLWKLTKAGKKVAICEQMSPAGKGIVERAVTRVVTPGTTFDEKVVDRKHNNYVATVVSLRSEKGGRGGRGGDLFGFAIADLTTGEFLVTEFDSFKAVADELKKFSPTEGIVERGSEFFDKLNGVFREFGGYVFEAQAVRDAEDFLMGHFGVKNLSVFGLEGRNGAKKAGAVLLNYLLETQKNELKHVRKVSFYSSSDYMAVDDSLVRNLELFLTNREGKREGSLVDVLDNTLTAMGARLMRKLIVTPLLDRARIEKRLDAVEFFVKDSGLLRGVRDILDKVYDIERLLARLSIGSGNARDLVALKQSLGVVADLKKLLNEARELEGVWGGFHDFQELVDLIDEAINEESPMSVRDGGMIRSGYNSELDDLKAISREGKGFIADLQRREIESTGINSLKIKYNKVFGYHIEVSKVNAGLVPDYYIRKQTLVNAERYFIPELKEYEDKVLNAEDRIKELEYELFYGVRMAVLERLKDIQELAVAVAYLDVYTNFAFNAERFSYRRPVFVEENVIRVVNGRHPVVERLSYLKDFVPNDCTLDESERFLLITGPNMGGKSTFLRQVAVLVLMAQIGSFVPVEEMSLGVVDRIFTRVGASDNLATGDSTFMVEMQEAAYILNNATERSLIILDEIGRGTSTYDGLSIAWAIMEYVHNVIGAKSLFATHYHELVDLAESLEKANNYSVMVREKDGEVKFMYKVVAGAVNKSYGIEVAKLAGLPRETVERAKEVLSRLEAEHDGVSTDGAIEKKQQEIVFDYSENRAHTSLVEELSEIDVDELTPLEALNKLSELKKNIKTNL
ncbi:DNA mismatch repair protein MutS [Candidatus Peregrinibacteria bacterium HGW-Peregrinibacteria-1]|nr:MAG: DNA mismatch repair protein MutS [Candidatus Peregrinibacteria bacterium HGW-Peregrinibacteria-1]